MMPREKLPRIALVWSQFTACHVDRCVAVAQRLEGRGQVVAVEVATTSREYSAFPQSGETGRALKRTLFPGRSFDDVPRWQRFIATLAAVKDCRIVCIGVPYSELDFVVLAFLLRVLGKQVVLLCDSKFDDRLRNYGFEFLKGIGLSCFSAVMVAGARGAAYFRFLGFRRRPILFGSDAVSIARIREEAARHNEAATTQFAERDLVYVGRFVPKKNLSLLIDAFAHYCQADSGSARRLLLIGSGPLEEQLRAEAAAKLPGGRVVFTGFLSGAELNGALSRALGLVLVSYSEQWGLVVNEALALGIPLIVGEGPGSRDLLVRNGVNGYVVEAGSVESIALAMHRLGASQAGWQAMRDVSYERAELGDVRYFVEAVELLLNPMSESAARSMAAYQGKCGEYMATAVLL